MHKAILMMISSLLVQFLFAQEAEYPYPDLSPNGKITQLVGSTQVVIDYNRPAVRSRKVFGGLVPWNKVWRTGAGRCTKIRFSEPVIVGGQPVSAGTYSMFTIPNPEEWIIILNQDTTQYGSYNYDPQLDVARFVTKPKTASRHYESLTFEIDVIPNNAKIFVSWSNVQLQFDLVTTTDESIEQYIERQLLTGKKTDSDLYAGAADYYLYQNENYQRALDLAKKALEIDPNNGWARAIPIRIYNRIGDYEKALIALRGDIQFYESRMDMNAADKQIEIDRLRKEYQAIEEKMNK